MQYIARELRREPSMGSIISAHEPSMPRKGDPITVSMQELRKTEEATAAKLKEQEHVIEELRDRIAKLEERDRELEERERERRAASAARTASPARGTSPGAAAAVRPRPKSGARVD